MIPAKVEVEEHHIGVYAGKKDGRVIKAPHPRALLHGSAVSPSLTAALMNGKYVNVVPLYHLEQEFTRYGLAIISHNIADWMIRLGEELLAYETPVLVNRYERPAGSKSYMWLYRSGHLHRDKQIVLYDYQKTRNSSHLKEFLKNYSGICVTNGY